MAEVNAGRVMILPLGNYNSATPYKVLDLVTYDGNSWLCRQDCTGVTPSDSASQFWQKFGSSVSIATVNTAGIVRPDGATITILADGTISVPIATINSLGLCRPDGQTIAINENGTISAQVAGALASLTDVQINSATQGQILQFDVTAGKWKNVTKQWLTELEQMEDVDIDTSTLANGQTLVYNSVTNKWENGSISSYPKLNDIPTVMANTQAGKVVDALVDKNVISGMSSNLETINSAASQNYTAGDIIYCTDGRWYTADVDITSGTTLVVGTNVTHTTQQVINTNLTQSLNGKLDGEWHLEVADSTSAYTMTHDFNEILVFTAVSANGDSTTLGYQAHFIKGKSAQVRSGYYASTQNFGISNINYNATTGVVDGTIISSGTTVTTYKTIYYR